MTKWKRGLAFALCLAMLFSLLPTPVFATEEQVLAGTVLEALEDAPGTAEAADSGASETPDETPPDNPSAVPDETPPDNPSAVPDEATENPSVIPDELSGGNAEQAVLAPEDKSAQTLSVEINVDGQTIKTDPGGQNSNPGGASNVVSPDGKKPEEPPAYEISYNLSGSGGQWMVVGGDESRVNEQVYALFNRDKERSYAIQLREKEEFPYFVEIRYRMEANGPWSVPETYRFNAPNETPVDASGNAVKSIKGHKITAQSKWLTNLQYTIKGVSYPVLKDNTDKYDENGNYLIDFPDDAEFPLSVAFEYQTKQTADGKYSSPNPYKLPATEDEPEKDPVFEDMNSSFDVLGQTFRLNPKVLGKAQYSIGNDSNWITVGPGEEREFDPHGNYTIDMRSRTDFPFKIYLRALDTDGWKYLPGKESKGTSFKEYLNVLDTATIENHVFALHTNWMNDVRYAFVEDSAFTSAAQEDYTLPDEESFFTVGTDIFRKEQEKENYDCFDENGNYTIELENSRKYPFHIVFQSIGPTGKWDSIANWKKDERMAHLYRFADVTETADYNGHMFSLHSEELGTIEYMVENGNGVITRYWTTFDKKSAEADNRCAIALREEETFPLTVKFRFLTEQGWSNNTEWKIPFKDWDKSEQKIKVIGKEYAFYLTADFLDDVRYYRGGTAESYTYVIPEARKTRPVASVYEADGAVTIPVKEAYPFTESDGNYRLDPKLTVEWWNPEKGWETAKGWTDFTKLSDTRTVETALSVRHTFRLQAPYTDEIRYRPQGDSKWIIVGTNQEKKEKEGGNYVLFTNGDYQIDLAEETVFPLTVDFEAYAETGWRKAEVKSNAKNAGTQTGFGVFEEAGTKLTVSNDGKTHVFSVYYPWANSVRYTLENRKPQSNQGEAPTVTIGQDRELARKDPLYQYVPARSNYVIEMEEGDFFPFKAKFSARDAAGKIIETAVKNKTTGETAEDTVTFTKNDQSEQYEVGGYTFTVHSNWMNTIRVYLPERTVSVGDGLDSEGKPLFGNSGNPDNNPLLRAWMQEHPNYQLFEEAGGKRYYTIPLRQTDTFPLTVEFLKRSVDGNPNPVKHTFESLNDEPWTFEGCEFRLSSAYTDTVRYIITYDEEIVKADGTLKAEYATAEYQDKFRTVVWDAEWAKHHKNYAAFNEDGSYQIPLPEDSSFPLDVWFAVADENASFDEVPYRKVTFSSRNDKAVIPLPAEEDFSPAPEKEEPDGPVTPESGGKLAVIKRNILTNTPLSGAEFKVTDEKGAVVNQGSADGVYITDANGKFTIANLQPGAYVVTETKAPEGYVLDTAPQTVTVTANETWTLTFNAPKHVFTVHADWMDEVFYTLPKVPKRADLPNPKEITVGMDKERAAVEAAAAKDERRAPLYVTYDEDGTYTIQLEDDAFFPYVVDVRYRLAGRQFKLPVIQEDAALYYDKNGELVWKVISNEEAIIPATDENGKVKKDENGYYSDWAKVPINNILEPVPGENGKQAVDGDKSPIFVKNVPAAASLIPVFENGKIRTYKGKICWKKVSGGQTVIPLLKEDGKTPILNEGNLQWVKAHLESNWVKGSFEFATPDSTAVWNGHTFKVHSVRTNPNMAVRANLVLGARKAPLRLAGMPASPLEPVNEAPPAPEPNPAPAQSDTEIPGESGGENNGNAQNVNENAQNGNENAQLQSTQPLTEVQLEADLTGFFNLELANAHVEVFMPNIATQKEEPAKTFVWGEWNMDNYGTNSKAWNINPWNRDEEGVSYRVVNAAEPETNKFDLSKYADTKGREQYFEIITGATERIEQLNLSNIRYLIRTRMQYPTYDELLKMKVAYVDDRRGGVYVLQDGYEHLDAEHWNDAAFIMPGLTTVGKDAYTYKTPEGEEKEVDVYRFMVGENWQDGRLWLTMKRNENARSYAAFKNLEADIYEGFYFTAEDAEANGKKLPESVWQQELDTQRVKDRYESYTDFVNGPKGIADGPKFTVVWKWNGYPVAIMPFRVIVDVRTTENYDEENNPIVIPPVTFKAPHTYNYFIPDANGNYAPPVDLELIGETNDTATGLFTASYYTKTEGSLYDNRYYVQATYNRNRGDWQADNIKVYVGPVKYDTLAEAVAASEKTDKTRAMDVTEQIFGAVGYGADFSDGYSEEGVVFSVFNRAGTLISNRKIVTYRREFLSFSDLTRPNGGPFIDHGIQKASVKSDMKEGEVYKKTLTYQLPESEYRGVYNGRSRYALKIGYMRDLIPSSLTEYGVKIVVATKAYESSSYEEIMAQPERPVDLTKDLDKDKDTQTVSFTAPYRNGFWFHLYDKDGNIKDCRYVKAEEPPMSDNTYFEAYGAQSVDGKSYQAYVMPGNMDSYYVNGYQTVFLLDGDKPVTDRKIVPLFEISEDDGHGNQVRIYASTGTKDDPTGGGERQNSGDVKSAVEFKSDSASAWDGSSLPIAYSAAATNRTHLKNYWVTFLTQQKGPKIFVNTANGMPPKYTAQDNIPEDEKGLPVRYVFLQKSTGNYQDIFIANIGDEPLENITVTFKKGDNANLYVDDYWTIADGSEATTLSAFTSTAIANVPGRGRYDDGYNQADVQLSNVAKIRVYPKNPDNSEAIDDVMIIAAHDSAGTETDRAEIKLTGRIGNYRIITDYLTGPEAKAPDEKYDDYSKDAVQYVSFSRLIQTNWPFGGNGVHFEVTEGRLPDGFPAPREEGATEEMEQIQPNGELFGVPLETGEFTFTVTATFSYPPGDNEPTYVSQDSRKYTLNVLPNEDANVEGQISKEYDVLLWVPDMTVTDGDKVLTEGEPLGKPGTDKRHRQGVAPVTIDGYQDVILKFEVEDGVDYVDDYEWVFAVYLNGERLTDGVHYTLHDGSAEINVDGQTNHDKANNGRNTLDVVGAKGRDENDTLKKQVSVNYNLTDTKKPSKSNNGNTTKPDNGNTVKPDNGNTVKPDNGNTISGGSSSSGGGSRTRPKDNGNTTPPKPQTYSVKINKISNGTLTPSVSKAVAGATVTLTAKPQDGYALNSVTVKDASGKTVKVNPTRDDNVRTFTMPASKVTITATFKPFFRVIAYADMAFGYLKFVPENDVSPGTRVNITAYPEEGYQVESYRAWDTKGEYVTVTVTGDNRAFFTMPSSNVEVNAVFVPVAPIKRLKDVKETDWFYHDVEWALERGIMNGVSDTAWAPQDNISTTTAVRTLFRLSMSDKTEEERNTILNEYASDIFAENRPWLPDSSAGYYREARWAAANNILTENVFTGSEALSRAKLAVILRNYLRFRGVQVEIPTPYEFFDSALIDAQGRELGENLNEAFQILREADVFRGDSTNAMLPNNRSTRAHMAALLHRLTDFIGAYEKRWTQAASEQAEG